ncbi:MAG: imelysin family protein [Balneolales bacterium]
MKRVTLSVLSIIILTVIGYSCSDDGPSGPDVLDFDRQSMLKNWADNIIIPSFTALSEKTEELDSTAERFASEPTLIHLEELRGAWEAAYLSFQNVSMFEMGQAMQLRYRDQMNIYPTDVVEIQNNIESGSYNLELPSLNDSQGFPALDYLLYGLSETDSGILEYYTTGTNSEDYRTYVTDLTTRIDELTREVNLHWIETYRDEFVQNDGGGANASVDMTVNDYIFYYEKALRAGKVGIPAGVFSGTPLSTHLEAYYRKDLSTDLLLQALNATQDFFNGKHFESDETGESLNSYLDYLNTIKNSDDLSTLINMQFDAARDKIESLDDNLVNQVENDNAQMLSAYDELQMNVVYMKVDMLQALNINVDYVDADGD